MGSDDALGSEPFVAKLAVVSFQLIPSRFASVPCAHVGGEIFLGGELFPTFCAFVGRRVGVGGRRWDGGDGGDGGGGRSDGRCRDRARSVSSNVRLQVGELGERLVARTNVTFIGSLARVASRVLPQMRELGEPLLAEFAPVRSFARMNPHMLV